MPLKSKSRFYILEIESGDRASGVEFGIHLWDSIANAETLKTLRDNCHGFYDKKIREAIKLACTTLDTERKQRNKKKGGR